MDRIAIIIQSEGKGHLSQAVEAMRILKEQGKEVVAVSIGRKPFQRLPDYFSEAFPKPFRTFYSPGFLIKRNKRGISLTRTLLMHLPLIPIYLFAALRLRMVIRLSRAEGVLNFYDPVGAVACSRLRKKRRIVSVSHHFYLSHPDFFSPRGFGIQPYLLGFMNNYFIRHSDNVLALSFRKAKSRGKIRVVPPLIDIRIRRSEPGKMGRDLCYLLNDGFIDPVSDHYIQNEDISLDLFVSGIPPATIKNRVHIHTAERRAFIERLKHCRRLICTAGFDTVAEAFYLGIPVYLVPSEDHLEQYCNALDASRTGMAFQMEQVSDLQDVDFEPRRNEAFRNWVAQAEERFMEVIGN